MAAAALLAGCATPPAADLGAITSGRLALRMAADGARPAQNVAAAFELQGSDKQGELRLISPLGTQVAAARWRPAEVSLETAGGVQRFDSLEQLSQQFLGQVLPLAALPDWLAGRPWGQAPFIRSADGFEQLGWLVLLAGRAEGLIEARRRADLGPEVLLRVRLEPAQ